MSSHQCHIKNDGSLKCWGNNNSGQLGLGDSNNRGDNSNEMGPYLPYVNVGKDLKVDQVCTGSSHTCVHLTSNQIKCWGSNASGQLGLDITDSLIGTLPTTTPDNYNPVDLGTDSYPTNVVCGGSYTCALFANKKVKCFGTAASGQIGYESTTNKGKAASDMGDNLPFVKFGTSVEVESIHTHSSCDHTCIIIATSQNMKCWGNGGSYRLGYSTSTSRGDAAGTMGDGLPYIDLGTEDKVKVITLGQQFTCALRVDEQLKCWGLGSNGVFSLGVSSTSTVINTGSQTSTSYGSGKKIKQLAAGGGHNCVLYDDNLTVKCVGLNLNGQVGQGDSTSKGTTSVTSLTGLSPVKLGTETLQISYLKVTGAFTCVIFVDNSIKCFGSGSNGALGSGATTSIGTSPTHMGTNLAFIDVFSTFAPTKSPSISPSQSPTNNPTTSPTTRNPTNNPTQPTPRVPTFNPTRKPTAFGFFGSQGSSLPFDVVKAFDLYLLIDTTRNYEKQNAYCIQYKLMSGASPSSCFDLMMDYAIEIVKSISVATNGYYSNDLSNGLRVQASLIQCVGSTKTPSSTTLFTLTGDSTTIMNGLNNVRTNTQLTELASCPIQGLYDVIQKIENEWSSVSNRPYKAIITLTDAVVNDATNPGVRLIDAVSGIRYRCTPSIVIVPFRMTDTSTQALNQQLSLKILTGNIDASVFEAKNAPWIVIPKIGEQISSLLIQSNTNRCSSSTSFSTTDKYWCGYNRPVVCSSRSSCEFINGVGNGCQKKQSQSGCVYGDQTSCESNTDCQWISSSSNTCTRKPEEPDCNALVLQSSCNNKSSFCSWNGSGCTTKFIPGPGR